MCVFGRLHFVGTCSSRGFSSHSGVWTLSLRTIHVGLCRLSMCTRRWRSCFSCSIWDFSSPFRTSNLSDSYRNTDDSEERKPTWAVELKSLNHCETQKEPGYEFCLREVTRWTTADHDFPRRSTKIMLGDIKRVFWSWLISFLIKTLLVQNLHHNKLGCVTEEVVGVAETYFL